MKLIKKALLGLLLASCALTQAIAGPTFDYDEVVFVPANDGGGLGQYWLFQLGDAAVVAGQTFQYQFLFNTPPSAPSTLFGFIVDGSDWLAFNGADFVALGGSITRPHGFQFNPTVSQVDGSGVLNSGVYDLYLSGTFLLNGAAVTGIAFDDLVPVPEPMSLGLAAAALCALGAVRRRSTATV